MTKPTLFAQCPPTLRQGEGDQAAFWQHAPDYAARPDEIVAELFHVVPIEAADGRCCPVYIQRSDTAPAVATGRLILQLQEDRLIESFDSTLAELGLRIVSTPKWAPHAGWVAATDGSLCHGLNQVPELLQRDGVVRVEAQLLMPSQKR